ncbi:hypothetical protein FACS1894211_03720 [Clostridia bacterium]|nr:hypothetical protein FACS1894211_03720 [Clostridia bacterium]
MQSAVLLIYEQIMEYVLDKIRCGEYKPGQTIVTEEAAAKFFYVSRGTVRKAYDQMESMGYIERRRGKGTVVSSDIFEKISPVKLNTEALAKTVGILLKDEGEFLAPIIRALDDRIIGNGWKSVLLFNDSIEKEYYCIRNLLKQKADGIIVIPFRQNSPFSYRNFFLLQDSHIPFVMIGKPPKGFNADAVYLDDGYASLQIMAELKRRRCEYSAHISDSSGDVIVVADRKEGYTLGFKKYFEGKSATFDVRDAKFAHKFEEFLDACKGKIGLNLTADFTMTYISDILSRRGLKPGKDIEVIGFGNERILENYGLRIPSVDIPKERIARAAVDVLKQKIIDPQDDRVTHKVFTSKIVNDYKYNG